MARQIKETPVLYGEDAKSFVNNMKNKKTETTEEKAERLFCYKSGLEMLKKGESMYKTTRNK